MASVAPPVSRIEQSGRRQYAVASRTLLGVAGSMFALLGVVVAVGGAYSSLDGGMFFNLAGFGMVLSGALLAKRHPIGVWTYLLVFGLTLVWALHGTRLGGSSLAYRLVGPIDMLVMISAVMPVLGAWSPRRTVWVCAALIIATVTIGTMADHADGPVGAAIAAAMHSTNSEGAAQSLAPEDEE